MALQRALGSVPSLTSCGPRLARALSTAAPAPSHLRKLVAMYRAAPISGLFNDHDIEYDASGATTIEFTTQKQHCHTAGTLHGAGY